MWQTHIFGVHWQHEGKMYYDEVHAESKEQAIEYFIDHKRDDVTLVRVDLIGPGEGGVRENTILPILPMGPLQAQQRLDADSNAR